MHFSNVLLAAAGIIGASAHPSGHAHLHRSAHADKRGFYKAAHSKVTVPATTTTTVAAASTSAAVASPAATSSSSAVKKDFCAGLSKRATAADIASTGNTGVEGHWGCNMMTVDESIASEYSYTTKFTNVDSEEYQVVCFNKIGPTGQIDGFWHAGLTFTVAAGASQDVAFDSNTQGGCAFGPGEVPKTSWGEYAGTWIEFDFGSERNNYWSAPTAPPWLLPLSLVSPSTAATSAPRTSLPALPSTPAALVSTPSLLAPLRSTAWVSTFPPVTSTSLSRLATRHKLANTGPINNFTTSYARWCSWTETSTPDRVEFGVI